MGWFPTVAVIEVSGLTKWFGQTLAVDNLSFTVEKGTVTGFLGPNGAGKTTTLRALLGLLKPTSGTALVNGRRYQDLTSPTREVGALLEASGFHPARTARNHLRTLAVVEGLPDARVDEVLALVGLSEAANRQVKGYSLGMRQRLGLAVAVLGQPNVLILDEPANGLDPEGIRWMRGFLRHQADQGSTVLVSSHVLTEMQQLVDQVVIINHGKLVIHSPLDELTRTVISKVRVRSPQAERLLDALRAAGHEVTTDGAGALTVTGATTDAVGDVAAAAGVTLHELSAPRFNLEDIFFELTGNGEPQPGGVARMEAPA
jgi:ABC-2 type transport system ATP-binding protein